MDSVIPLGHRLHMTFLPSIFSWMVLEVFSTSSFAEFSASQADTALFFSVASGDGSWRCFSAS